MTQIQNTKSIQSPPNTDHKLRRTATRLEAGLKTIYYMMEIAAKKDFAQFFEKHTEPCSLKFIHHTSRYVALQKYVCSLTDVNRESNNCGMMRIVYIALKACFDDNLDNVWTM